MARLKDQYREQIAPALKERFGIENPMRVPRLEKIVVNMGVGEAAQNSRALDGAMEDLAKITGQKPQMRRARKSIAGFKIREGMPVGARVTLRGERMWEFLDRLISVALPRVRDFRRSEEHTSELQSRQYLVCRLLLEKKKKPGGDDLRADRG